MRSNRFMKRQKVLLPLALALVIAGNIALQGWFRAAPDRLTAALTDLSGDRAALDAFPIGLSLKSEQLAQNLEIKGGTVSSSVEYDRGLPQSETVLQPFDLTDAVLIPAKDANTTVTDGILPLITFGSLSDQREEYIMTTDRAQIYLTGRVAADSDSYSTSNYLCIPSDMYLQSTEPEISIGYYYENQFRSGSSKTASRTLDVYGATFGPNRMNEENYGAFHMDFQSVRCAGQVFFMPSPSGVIDETCRSTVSFGGSCSLYRVVDTELQTDIYRDWPDKIETCGQAQTVLSFPARDCSLLSLQSIDDKYVFLAVYADRTLHFYLLNPDGTVRDSVILPVGDELPDDLSWSCENEFSNRDSDGTPCRTFSLTASNETREDENTVIVNVAQSEYLTFRIPDRLELVSRQEDDIAFDPALIAWRDGKLLVIDVQKNWNSYTNSTKTDITRFINAYRTQVLLSVYDQAGCLYRGEVLTDINDQYCRTEYRWFTDFSLLDDPESLRQYREGWYI